MIRTTRVFELLRSPTDVYWVKCIKWRPYRDLRIYCVYVKLCMFLFFNLASVLRKSSCIILHLQIDAKRDSLGNVEINRLHWNQSDEQHEEEEEEV